MAVKASQLENPERDLRLANRPAIVEPSGPPPDELAALRGRLKTARQIEPPSTGRKGLHCRDCFDRGRDAAIAHIEGE